MNTLLQRFVLVSQMVALSLSGACQTSSAGEQAVPAVAPAQALIFDQITTRYSYNADGTGIRSTEVRVRVLSSAGVQALGQLVFGYNSESEQFAVDFVRVRKNSGEIVNTPVERAPEVSLEISKTAPTYTDYREKHISVAALAPGDVLEYKATATVTKPLAPNQFWITHFFNKESEVREERLIVQTPRGRELKIKSGSPYSFEELGESRVYTWKTSNTIPEQGKAKKETGSVQDEVLPDVQLSTFSSWQEVARWYEGLLGSRIAVSPDVQAKADELTRGAKDQDEKARRLYDFVSRHIRYVSLSFGVGRYQPHAAADVLHNEYGDCKDKHTLLAALLQSAGIKSHAVLIDSQHVLDPDVPSPSQFNHLITAAEISGATIWLDTTVAVAPFGLILPPLRDKQALLVASDRPNPLVRTPDGSPVANRELLDVEGQFNEAGDLEATFTLSLQGDPAVFIRASARDTPQSRWKDLMQGLSYLSGFAGEVSQVRIDHVEEPEMPLQVSYHYSRKSYFTADEHNQALGRNTMPFPSVAVGPENISTLRKDSGLKLGGPLEIVQRARLKFTTGQAPTPPIAITVSRDYGSYTSKYEVQGNELAAERIYVIKAASLASSRDRDLQSFLTAISNDKEQSLVIKLAPKSFTAANGSDTDPVKLNDAALARLNANDYAGAQEFAEKAVHADPQSLYAWNNLGRAYLGQGQLESAEKAFRKQIEINPYDAYAYNNLGNVLRDTNRKDEAIDAFRKQIEVVPLDRFAHKNLGVLLFQLERYAEAVPELEKASQIVPEDGRVKVMLSHAYRNTGQNDKANALRQLLSKWELPPADNVFKTFIDDQSDPKGALQEARAGLLKYESSFAYNSGTGKINFSAVAVSGAWGKIGWSYFRLNQLEDAERYLRAAWTMSQSADIGSRLAQVYEKEQKTDLAMQIYAEALSGEGNREGIRERLLRLAGDEHKVSQMEQTARTHLSERRTAILSRSAAQSASADLGLVFAHGPQPDQVIFRGGSPSLFDRYTAAIKAHKFAIVYPDEIPQHVVREAILHCVPAGCTVVLMPLLVNRPDVPSGVVEAPQ